MRRRTSCAGEGEFARIIKIRRNVFVGVVTQVLFGVTVLEQERACRTMQFFYFLTRSATNWTFSCYAVLALANLKFLETFTPDLMRTDPHLWLKAGRTFGCLLPRVGGTRDLVRIIIWHGHKQHDLAARILLQERVASIELESQNIEVDNGTR